uniref:U3 small nucleolar RNA-associated protein 15 homolog n=1 Tax=Jaculus jaculus TaxID=51337 RepID=A0A8C5KIF2_JACJA
MASYKPVAIQTYPVLGEKVTQDTLYWNNYKTPVQIKEFGAVSKVDFSPQPPYNYAVTASSRIHIYGRFSQEPIKTFSRFKDTAYCATFRHDVQLLVAGSEDGRVQLLDIHERAPLRQFEGSYDHTVKIKNVFCVKHGQAVESVLLFPSGGLLVSSGGRYVKVWDMLKGGQLLVSLKNHHKTVTCLCLSSSGQRLLSGSLDRKVKVYSTASYKVVHSFDYTASILSLALAHEDETIVVGMTNGILSVKHRKSEAKKDSLPRRRRPAYRTFIKGKNYMKQRDDILINRPTKKHLEWYDKDLKNFRISKALDRVLEPNCVIKTPEVTVSIIKELNRRGVLANALAGRDEKEITRVLNFLIRNLSQPRFAPVLINAAEIIIDIYLPVIGQSPVVDKKFIVLQGLIEKEIDYQRELLETLGMMDMLFASMTRNESTCVLEHTPIFFFSFSPR